MSNYGWPFKEPFKVTCEYGIKSSRWKCGYHSGLDIVSIAAGGDGRIFPISEGTVIQVAASDTYGNYVTVSHPDSMVSLYAHLKSVAVRKGEEVSRNTALGIEGETGNVSGRHLHFEVHKGVYRYPSTTGPGKFIMEKMAQNAAEKPTASATLNPVGKASAMPGGNMSGTTTLNTAVKEDSMTLKEVPVTVGDKKINGYLIDDVTYVPLREIVEAIRPTVTWTSETGASVKL